MVERGEQRVDHCGGDEGAGSVVDQDVGDAFAFESLKPGADRVAAFGSAFDEADVFELCIAGLILLALADDDDGLGYYRVGG